MRNSNNVGILLCVYLSKQQRRLKTHSNIMKELTLMSVSNAS